MAESRAVPRPFTMHWGSGQVVEEAGVNLEHHNPAIQLLRFDEGEAAGSLSVRFCYYSHDGRFQRSPLLLSEADIEPLRDAVRQTPQLRELLRRLCE
jgi:hypothetical protein